MPTTTKKCIFISAASSDLGLVIVKKLLDLGHQIVAHYSSNSAKLKELESPNLMIIQADLSDDREVEAMAATAIKKFGRIDVLINMIGPYSETNILEETPANWRRSIELNLNVIFATCHYFQVELMRNKGHILNFGYAGVEQISGWPSATAYAAAKARLAVFTKSLTQAMGPHGVRVNAICPGWMDNGHIPESKLQKVLTQIPQSRLGRPSEIADVVHWLIDESPSYITGALLPIGGGIEFPVS